MIGIYKITNPYNEVYIGQSKNIAQRICQHKNNSSNYGLKESIKKFGYDNHKIEVIEECDASVLLERERFFIELHKEKYILFNEDLGGARENSGRKKGIETTTMRVPLFLKEIIEGYINRKVNKV